MWMFGVAHVVLSGPATPATSPAVDAEELDSRI
jgi:hypothetical protein